VIICFSFAGGNVLMNYYLSLFEEDKAHEKLETEDDLLLNDQVECDS